MSRKRTQTARGVDTRANPMEARHTSQAMARWHMMVTQQFLALSPSEAHTIAQIEERFRVEDMAQVRPGTYAWMDRYLTAIVRDVGRKPVTSEFRGAALRWYANLEPTPANKQTYLLGRLLDKACALGWRLEQHDLKGLCELRVQKRDRVLTLPMRVELFRETSRPASARRRVALDCIRFLALTGWRVSEACGLRRDWIEHDEDEVVARLPVTKTGPSVRVLGRDALELLASLPNEGPWYFPHRDGKRGIGKASVTMAFGRIAKAKGWEGIVLHSLRHTMVTVGCQLRLPLTHIAAAIGQTGKYTVHQYDHPQREDVRDACDAVAKALIAGRKSR